MRIEFDILTLFPEIAEGFLTSGMLGRGQRNGLVRAEAHQLRNWAKSKHNKTDDIPYGGGAGMVMKPEPIFAAVESLRRPESKVVHMAPDGEKLTGRLAREFLLEKHWIVISGHYEGVDQRVRDHLIDREVSVGDYILTNGTLAAAVMIDCVSRFVPGFLGDEKSLTEESFTDNLLGFPQYTRPSEFRGMCVPEVLLSGNHAEIAKWRRNRQIEKTKRLRPDILDKGESKP